MLGFFSSPAIVNLVQDYGPLAVFGLVALESVGLPLPGEAALISAALYAGTTGHLNIFEVIAAAAAGAILGDNFGYLIGRKLGLPLLMRYGPYVRLSHRRLIVGRYLFWRHGGKIVFFGRFITFLRAFAALLAGANEMPWRHFLLFNALGGIIWATAYGGGTYLLGEKMTRLASPISAGMLAAAIIGIIAGFVLIRRHEKDLEARAQQVFPDSIEP